MPWWYLSGISGPPCCPIQRTRASVLSLDPVRAHLLDALELEGPHPLPRQPAVGWLHYPLQQQSLLPLADPVAYWNAVERVRADLAAEGLPLRLARKPPLEPKGLGDAVAQGMAVILECLPLAELLASSTVVIAPGHLGTGHLEAIARGRPVVLVSPERLNRPSQLLENQAIPLPRLPGADFLGWWKGHDAAALDRLAKEQAEWLRQQLVTTQSLIGWLVAWGSSTQPPPEVSWQWADGPATPDGTGRGDGSPQSTGGRPAEDGSRSGVGSPAALGEGPMSSTPPRGWAKLRRKGRIAMQILGELAPRQPGWAAAGAGGTPGAPAGALPQSALGGSVADPAPAGTTGGAGAAAPERSDALPRPAGGSSPLEADASGTATAETHHGPSHGAHGGGLGELR